MSFKPVLAEFSRVRWIVFASLVAAGLALVWWGWRHRDNGQPGKPAVAASIGAAPSANKPSIANPSANLHPAAHPPAATGTNAPGETPNYSWFQKRPLAVARESGAYQWTAEDGKDLNVIQKLAHNGREFERLVAENDRIIRRQLIYHTDTTDALVQRARLSGETIQQFTLPGLDGQEVQFEVVKMELSASGQQGAFAGRVAGRLDSTVTLAFKGGREAFTVISPSEGLYLQGDPREPGELIVKSVNPETYVLGTCGTP